MEMKKLSQDLSVYSKLNFEKPPVGVKFTFFPPDGIDQLKPDKKLSLCEMVKETQENNAPFYFSKNNNETCVGKILLGMEDMAPFAESGQIGERLGVFQEARANQHFYQFVPKMEKGIVNNVVFSPIEKLSFEPDVLVITATPSQAEIVMRALTYSTGELYTSTTTPVMGCAWFLIYPYKTGKVNYIIPELIHGPKGRELWAENTLIISIPYHWIPTVTRNLQKMQWHLSSHENKEEYYSEFAQILTELAKESETI
ncbi:MAG: DUF169 domain-containing protein [Desulfobacteraceae bacterium]|jgi:uncharacterized protein (DUF169 family)